MIRFLRNAPRNVLCSRDGPQATLRTLGQGLMPHGRGRGGPWVWPVGVAVDAIRLGVTTVAGLQKLVQLHPGLAAATVLDLDFQLSISLLGLRRRLQHRAIS